MPSRPRPARTPPVVFDDAAWADDLLERPGPLGPSLRTRAERLQRTVWRSIS